MFSRTLQQLVEACKNYIFLKYFQASYLTKLFKHLIALVKNEMLDVLHVQRLVSCQGENPARCTDHDVGTVSLECLLIIPDVNTTKEDTNLDVVHVF